MNIDYGFDEQKDFKAVQKEAYVPPEIKFTEIEVEQALMGFCKSSGSGGMPAGCNGSCTFPGS